ncbi:NifU-like protein 1 chloroplastic [Bienertia sinuspersici]
MASLNLAGLTKNLSIFLIKNPVKSYKSSCFATFGEKKHNFLKRVNLKGVIRASASNGSPGLYSSKQFELSIKNVDMILEEVRPYLIADGGDVDVVSVEDGIITLQLQGFHLLSLLSSVECS